MILAVNVGNSSTAFGICRDSNWLGRWRIRTVHERTPAEYSLLFDRFLHEQLLLGADLDSGIRINTDNPAEVGTDLVTTGGQAEIIAPLTDRIDKVEPWLNLDGLRLIAESNPIR